MSIGDGSVRLPEYLPAGLDVVCEPAREDEVWLRLAPDGFDAASRVLVDGGARFVTLLIADSPERSLLGVFALRGDLVVLRAPMRPGSPLPLPALGVWLPAARWAEQELLERLDIPSAAGFGRRLTEPDASLLDEQVEGLDVFSFPTALCAPGCSRRFSS